MANTKENILIGNILYKYLRGEASEQEVEYVNIWLLDPQNRAFLEELKHTSRLTDGAYSMNEINKEKYTLSFEKKISVIKFRRNIYSFLKCAAIVAIVVCISVFLFNNLNNQEPCKVAINPHELIKPGGNKATLITSEGQKYILGEDSCADLLKNKDETVVKVRDDTLIYKVTRRKGNAPKKIKYNTLVVPKNGEFILNLSDGARVWVNSDSKLIYPEEFLGKDRLVYLEGEAFFEVAGDLNKPFVVETESAKIKVLGTGFNVRSYKNEVHATTLVHGKVEVETSLKKKVLLTPGYQVLITNNNLKVKKVDVHYATAWKDGFFMFHNENLDYIMKELSRWYDFEYFFQNNSASQELFTSKIKRFDDFDAVLDILQATNKIKFQKKGKLVIIKAK